MSTPSFAELNLSPDALRALARAGFERPTPIQARAIPPALAGRDVIGTAATGTGKTAAFLLPILERLTGKTGTRALVLAPTRELALQIGGELERFARGRDLRGAVVIGGVGMAAPAEALRRAAVVIATPGRLVDHLQQGSARGVAPEAELLFIHLSTGLRSGEDLGDSVRILEALAMAVQNRRLHEAGFNGDAAGK